VIVVAIMQNQDNADGVKNTVNGWVQQRKWPAPFRQKPLNIQLISMVNSSGLR
jgi:hypothetical protein